MDEHAPVSVAGLYVINDCLIVPVAADLDEDGLEYLKKEVLHRLKTTGTRGVLINVSAVSILGSLGFSILRNTARAVEMMGGRVVFVGFQPGVAAALVDFEADLEGILTTITAEDAFEILSVQPQGNETENNDPEENSRQEGFEGDNGTII